MEIKPWIPRFSLFGNKPTVAKPDANASIGETSTSSMEPDSSLKNRFPAMRVLASCIKSLTAGISTIGNALGNIAWSAYRAVVSTCTRKSDLANPESRSRSSSVDSSNSENSFLTDVSSVSGDSKIVTTTGTLSEEAKQEFQTFLNNPIDPEDPEKKLLFTDYTRRDHAWTNNTEGPLISEQFFTDHVERSGLLIQEKDDLPKPLVSTTVFAQVKKDGSKADEEIFIAGAKTFTDFVGDPVKALWISRYINQQMISPLFNQLFTKNNYFFLPEVGSVTPLGGIKASFILSKADNKDLVLHYEQNQTPTMFTTKEITGQLSSTSFVKQSCDITFKKDTLIEVSPINYQYYLEKET